VILKGKHVTLRPITVADAETTLKWRLSDRAKFLQRGAQSIQEQENWIGGSLNKTNETTFIIEYDSKPVGMIAVCEINKTHNHCVYGRLLIGEKETAATAPVAFESELLICDYIFNELKMHKLYGDMLEENTEMVKFRKYLGYKFEGMQRDHYLINGEYKNILFVSLLDSEYQSITRKRLLNLITISRA